MGVRTFGLLLAVVCCCTVAVESCFFLDVICIMKENVKKGITETVNIQKFESLADKVSETIDFAKNLASKAETFADKYVDKVDQLVDKHINKIQYYVSTQLVNQAEAVIIRAMERLLIEVTTLSNNLMEEFWCVRDTSLLELDNTLRSYFYNSKVTILGQTTSVISPDQMKANCARALRVDLTSSQMSIVARYKLAKCIALYNINEHSSMEEVMIAYAEMEKILFGYYCYGKYATVLQTLFMKELIQVKAVVNSYSSFMMRDNVTIDSLEVVHDENIICCNGNTNRLSFLIMILVFTYWLLI